MNAQEARIQATKIRDEGDFAAKTKIYSKIKAAVADGKFSIVEYEIPYDVRERLEAVLKADGFTTKYFDGGQLGGNSLTVSW